MAESFSTCRVWGALLQCHSDAWCWAAQPCMPKDTPRAGRLGWHSGFPIRCHSHPAAQLHNLPHQTDTTRNAWLAALLLILCTVRELWHQAAHDSTEQELNFQLIRLAHAAVNAGLSDPTSLFLPMLHLLPQRVLLSYGEQVVLDTAQGLDKVYSQSVQDQYFERWHPASLRPTASEFLQLLEQGFLSAQVMKRAFALRTMFLHPAPSQSIPLECHYCGAVVHDPQMHVRGECLPSFLLQRGLRAQALRLLLLLLQGKVESLSSLVLLGGCYRLQFTLDGPQYPQLQPDRYPLESDRVTATGLCYSEGLSAGIS